MKKLFLHLLTTSVGFVLVLVPLAGLCIFLEWVRDLVLSCIATIKHRLRRSVQGSEQH